MSRRAVCTQWVVWSTLALAITAPGWAHHSFAGYDMAKTLSTEGTLKEFRWGAPHSSAVFMIKGPDGKIEAMTLAAAAPSLFSKQGLKPRDFQVGDKMQISWHPSTSGHIGGMLATLKLPNGHEFKDTEADPGSAFSVTGAKQAETAQ